MSGLKLGNNSLIKHAAFLESESICFDSLLTLINNFKHSEDFDNSLTLLNERINQYKTEKYQNITVDPLDLRLSTELLPPISVPILQNYFIYLSINLFYLLITLKKSECF
jgi:hypothetical protein